MRSDLSRRSFVGVAAGVGLGLSPLVAEDRQEISALSGLVTGKPRPLDYKELSGYLSAEQIRWHHESHYGGALKGFNRLDANPRGEHRKRVATANSVLLHELYFENMTSKAVQPEAATVTCLKQRFGSVDRWMADFHAAAISCRGWAVLAWHPVNAKLYNVVSDSHEDGPVWAGIPLVVVDCYEHAYYMDFQNQKSAYLNGFTDHLNWPVLERRIRACQG